MTAEAQPFALHVDIVSDVVCPWCIIGYKQFEKALQSMPQRFELTLQWHPFELNPKMPAAGQNLREHLAQKYGAGPEQSQANRKRLSELGTSLGFHFDYFDGMRVVNTFRAHQLLHWAEEQGKQTALKLKLFSAFFSERKDVHDISVLSDAAASVGLCAREAESILHDERYADAVRAQEQRWLDQEIHAVPAFIFNNRYSVMGAQDADTFARVLNKIVESS